MFAFTFAIFSLIASVHVQAAVTPTSPESATTVRIGQPLTALWSADTTGMWTDMTVQLMTGDNLQMIPLTTLSTGIDGTKETTHSWTTPNVFPTSKIYFLQFTRTGDPTSAQWTTRFTIAGADGSTSTPSNSTTYTAAQGPVQWGVGAIVGGNGAGSTPISASTSASSASGVPTISVAPTTDVPSSTTSSSASSSSSTSSSRSVAASVTSAGAAAASSSRAAAGKLAVGGVMGMVLAVVGAVVMV